MNNISAIIKKSLHSEKISVEHYHFFFESFILGKVSDLELCALLVSTRLQEYPAELIVGAVSAFREHATKIEVSGDDIIDCCGTGGDNSGSINISSIVALLGASSGLKVAKHGNRSVTSKCGSADLFEALGIKINMTPQVAARLLTKTGFTFIFAPLYHGGIKNAATVRKLLGVGTVFNILGPLLNPTKPKFQIIGVYDRSLQLKIAQAVAELGVESAWVVNSMGVDEITLGNETMVVEVNSKSIKSFTLTPADFGLAVDKTSLKAGSPAENAALTLEILQGKGADIYNKTVAVNLAAMHKIKGSTKDLKLLVQEQLSNLKSGQALQKLETIITESNAPSDS